MQKSSVHEDATGCPNLGIFSNKQVNAMQGFHCISDEDEIFETVSIETCFDRVGQNEPLIFHQKLVIIMKYLCGQKSWQK